MGYILKTLVKNHGKYFCRLANKEKSTIGPLRYIILPAF